MTGGITAGGAWALRFPPPSLLKFFGIVRGDAWLAVEGLGAPIHLVAGDVFLLAAPRAFVMGSAPDVEPMDALAVFSAQAGPIRQVGEGDAYFSIGGHVQLDATHGGLLHSVLPPLIHVPAASPQAVALQWLLAQLVEERAAALPGAVVASEQLAHLMFVQILRAHLASAGLPAAGWLRAVSDRRLAPALRLMHGDPGRPWQLGELARAAAMSRTSFAEHFRTVTGVAPLAYLTQWRMRLAERALREEDTQVSVLARSLGYTSESAFSNAFKRVTGNAPLRYRRAVRAVPGRTEETVEA